MSDNYENTFFNPFDDDSEQIKDSQVGTDTEGGTFVVSEGFSRASDDSITISATESLNKIQIVGEDGIKISLSSISGTTAKYTISAPSFSLGQSQLASGLTVSTGTTGRLAYYVSSTSIGETAQNLIYTPGTGTLSYSTATLSNLLNIQSSDANKGIRFNFSSGDPSKIYGDLGNLSLSSQGSNITLAATAADGISFDDSYVISQYGIIIENPSSWHTTNSRNVALKIAAPNNSVPIHVGTSDFIIDKTTDANVGIGTATPSYKLHVVGDVSGSDAHFDNTFVNHLTSSDDVTIGGDGNFARIRLRRSDDAVVGEIFQNAGTTDIINNQGSGIRLMYQGTPLMHAKTTGVSLGYSQTNLHQVTGSMHISGATTGHLTASGHVSASIFYGDGSSLTGINFDPAGNNTEIQFNDSGIFGASSDFTWNDSSKQLTVNGQFTLQNNSPILKIKNNQTSTFGMELDYGGVKLYSVKSYLPSGEIRHDTAGNSYYQTFYADGNKVLTLRGASGGSAEITGSMAISGSSHSIKGDLTLIDPAIAGRSRLYFQSGGSVTPYIGTVASQIEMNAGSYGITLKNNTTNTMRILSNRVGIAISGAEPQKALEVGGEVRFGASTANIHQITGSTYFNIPDNNANAFSITGDGHEYIKIDTTDNSETITLKPNSGSSYPILTMDQGYTQLIQTIGNYLYLSGTNFRIYGSPITNHLYLNNSYWQVTGHQFGSLETTRIDQNANFYHRLTPASSSIFSIEEYDTAYNKVGDYLNIASSTDNISLSGSSIQMTGSTYFDDEVYIKTGASETPLTLQIGSSTSSILRFQGNGSNTLSYIAGSGGGWYHSFKTNNTAERFLIGDNYSAFRNSVQVTGSLNVSTNITASGTVSASAFYGDGSALTNLPPGGISNVVEDTTPQLGGDLDMNGQIITGTLETSGNFNLHGPTAVGQENQTAWRPRVYSNNGQLVLQGGQNTSTNITIAGGNITHAGNLLAYGVYNQIRLQDGNSGGRFRLFEANSGRDRLEMHAFNKYTNFYVHQASPYVFRIVDGSGSSDVGNDYMTISGSDQSMRLSGSTIQITGSLLLSDGTTEQLSVTPSEINVGTGNTATDIKFGRTVNNNPILFLDASASKVEINHATGFFRAGNDGMMSYINGANDGIQEYLQGANTYWGVRDGGGEFALKVTKNGSGDNAGTTITNALGTSSNFIVKSTGSQVYIDVDSATNTIDLNASTTEVVGSSFRTDNTTVVLSASSAVVDAIALKGNTDIYEDTRIRKDLTVGFVGNGNAIINLARGSTGQTVGKIEQSDTITYFDNIQGAGIKFRVNSTSLFEMMHIKSTGVDIGRTGTDISTVNGALHLDSGATSKLGGSGDIVNGSRVYLPRGNAYLDIGGTSHGIITVGQSVRERLRNDYGQDAYYHVKGQSDTNPALKVNSYANASSPPTIEVSASVTQITGDLEVTGNILIPLSQGGTIGFEDSAGTWNSPTRGMSTSGTNGHLYINSSYGNGGTLYLNNSFTYNYRAASHTARARYTSPGTTYGGNNGDSYHSLFGTSGISVWSLYLHDNGNAAVGMPTNATSGYPHYHIDLPDRFTVYGTSNITGSSYGSDDLSIKSESPGIALIDKVGTTKNNFKISNDGGVMQVSIDTDDDLTKSFGGPHYDDITSAFAIRAGTNGYGKININANAVDTALYVKDITGSAGDTEASYTAWILNGAGNDNAGGLKITAGPSSTPSKDVPILGAYNAAGTAIGALMYDNAGGAFTLYSVSDESLKDNIQLSEVDCIEKIKNINLYSYDWKAGGHTDIGFIAQDLEKEVPSAVTDEEIKKISEQKLIPILTKAIQQQQEMIEQLLNRVEELENK